ncbi:MAG: TrmH family RNA methyltransferase, partial [Acidimicrobiales bacterium]
GRGRAPGRTDRDRGAAGRFGRAPGRTDRDRGAAGRWDDNEGSSRSMGRAATTGRNLWTPAPGKGAPRGPSFPRGPGGTARAPKAHTLGGEQVEGRQAVRVLLLAGHRAVREVWMAEGSDPSPILADIDRLARERHVPVRLVSHRRLESVQGTETPQGVVAFAEELTAVSLSELVQGAPSRDSGRAAHEPAEAPLSPRSPFIVVIDGITDPQNLGSILRSAECAGGTGAAIPRHRSAHVTPAVAKAASGAIEHLPLALVAGVPSALQELSEQGVMTIGLEEDASTSFFDLELSDKAVALVLGAEGRGLTPLARRRCSVLASLPLAGDIPSLNVAAAAAVACFEVARQRARHSGRASS